MLPSPSNIKQKSRLKRNNGIQPQYLNFRESFPTKIYIWHLSDVRFKKTHYNENQQYKYIMTTTQNNNEQSGWQLRDPVGKNAYRAHWFILEISKYKRTHV